MTKRRRPTLVREEERADILTMSRAGYSIARVAELLDRSEATVAKVIHEERDRLRAQHEADLMASYMVAVKVAAENGDGKPAMDLMDRLAIVPETSRQRTAIAVAQMTSDAQRAMVSNGRHGSGAHGPMVQIGIAMPGQLSPAVSVTSSQVSENFTLASIPGENVRHVARISSDPDAK